MEKQQPSIGRIVHFKSDAGSTYPAMILAVHDDQLVDLQVFAPGVSPYQLNAVPFTQPNPGADQASETWMWPPRV